MRQAINQLKCMHDKKVNGKKGGSDKKSSESPEATGIQKSLADVVKSMQEATKVFKTQTEAAAKKADEAKKDEAKKPTEEKKTDTSSDKKGGDADSKGKEFSYTTKTGKTAHIFNVNQKGSVVEFDAAFDDAKK